MAKKPTTTKKTKATASRKGASTTPSAKTTEATNERKSKVDSDSSPDQSPAPQSTSARGKAAESAQVSATPEAKAAASTPDSTADPGPKPKPKPGVTATTTEATGAAKAKTWPAAEPEIPAAEPSATRALEPAPTSPPESEPQPSAEQPAPVPAPTEPEPTPEPPAVRHPPRPSLFIVHITPEMAPVAKIGGLADVVFGLGRELAIRGNHVEIILPKHDNLRYDHIFELHPVYNDLWVPWYDGAIHCTVYFGFVHDRKCFFIEPHSPDNFFNRGRIYGFPDDVLRYAFFSRAAIEYLWQAGKHPDIIHCHDWQTALVPVFLYEFYQRLGMTHPRACLTIHNIKHQGVTGAELLRATGLHQPERFFDWHRLGDNHHKNALNLLKGGVVYANFVTTVSPRYAFETKDQGQGFGLEPTLHTHHMKYGGVVNGIDYDVWNPEIDRYIPAHYGLDTLDAKYENKRALRHRLMLADNEKPIVAFIGRLDPQKGLELVRHAIFSTLERGAQFVLLGSSHDQGINNDFWGLKHMLNDSPDCHLEIGFDEDLSHLIYAGADIMLVPSQFEPCGLTQLIALRYATVPVVRTVGGLADTVFDKDHSDRPLHQRNGYRFDNYDVPGLESALIRAIDCYYQYPEHFRELMKNAMRSDYSWNHPGQDYLNIYDFIRDR
ncbi:glycogen synthase [Halochromatium salexigens]|uniref:Glycogen synthase n=1 Tax=Halochromatium salexigens TaxID=49447 RepID=A0AAJ0XES2_HALSE|nr:glycogen synthase [Halochromatium salexigens]MBK5929488.1 starch synthase [Halochromatium salexigens]